MNAKRRIILRKHARARVTLNAVLVAGSQRTGTYLVTNLSAGGALLEGTNLVNVGETLDLAIELPDRPPILVKGRVVRTEIEAGGDVRIAVAFVELPIDSEAALRTLVTEEIRASRARGEAFVLVVDPDPSSREQFEKELAQRSRNVATAAFFLNALYWLQDPNVRIEVAFVEVVSSTDEGTDLLRFLRDEFPWIRRVAISSEMNRKELDHAVRSGMAHAALMKPWGSDRIAQVLTTADIKVQGP